MRSLSQRTVDLKEIIVDYKSKKIDLGDALISETTYERVYSIVSGVLQFSIIPAIYVIFLFAVFFGSLDYLFDTSYTSTFVMYIVILYILSSFFCGILSLFSKRFDEWIRLFIVTKTGRVVGKLSKLNITNLKSKVFVIYDVKNFELNYELSGDFKKFISKVHVKREPEVCRIYNQANLISFLRGDDLKMENIWNAYFYFDRVPKKGNLYVEYI